MTGTVSNCWVALFRATEGSETNPLKKKKKKMLWAPF